MPDKSKTRYVPDTVHGYWVRCCSIRLVLTDSSNTTATYPITMHCIRYIPGFPIISIKIDKCTLENTTGTFCEYIGVLSLYERFAENVSTRLSLNI